MASPWCRPVFCPWTLNLPIAIVLLRLRVHYSVEIKRYKSQIRIRMGYSLLIALVNRRTDLHVFNDLSSSIYKVYFKSNSMSLGLVLLEEKLFVRTWSSHNGAIMSADIKKALKGDTRLYSTREVI